MPGTPMPSVPEATARPLDTGRNRVIVAAVIDVAIVFAFAIGGRASHEADSSSLVVLRIVWPFLIGLAVGWFFSRAWRQPFNARPVGLIIAFLTWADGILIRVLLGEGVAVPFLIVSCAFLFATLFGWRLVAGWIIRLRAKN